MMMLYSRVRTILFMVSIVLMPIQLQAYIDPAVTLNTSCEKIRTDNQSGNRDTNSRRDLYVPSEYSTIQAAIISADAGDTIRVADGTYTGTGNKDLDFGGKDITVQSISEDPALCVIDCENSGRGFYFHSGETNDAVVMGFTIRNGLITGGIWPEDSGGGILIDEASPTISNCIIANNTADSGGGISSVGTTSTIIMNCLITGNSSNLCGGIQCHDSTRVINCRISNNVAVGFGGGIYAFHSSQVINCIISGNEADLGGGCAIRHDVELLNCEISGNTASNRGGAVYATNAHVSAINCTIINCTMTGNTATNIGGGLCVISSMPQESVFVTNSILWGNTAGGSGNEIYNSVAELTVEYSDIEGGWSGTGNINSNPLFVSGPGGDFYLSQTASGQLLDSPCLNAGSGFAAAICWNSGTVCLDAYTTRTDLRFETGLVDMGYHDPDAGSNVINVPADYTTIQTAIDASFDGGTVMVSDGTYTGAGNKDLDFGGRNITVQSFSEDPALCVIDCENSGRGFNFHSGETNNAVVMGFTIRNGFTTGGVFQESSGGGIYINNSSPTISNCIIANNVADSGGGISSEGTTSAIITNCVITGNSTNGHSGGIQCQDHTRVIDCRISDNIAAGYGGGIYAADSSQIFNSIITGNEANQGGGCWVSDDTELINCEITDNTASDFGGGVYTNESDILVMNCTISGNTATNDGGGLCVIASSLRGAPFVTDSIFWGNSAGGSGNEIYDSVAELTVENSNIEGGWPGAGNIDSDPLFLTGPGGDFYLSQIASGQSLDSPCVNAGSGSASIICWNNGGVCLDELTTRTDFIVDTGHVDMGFHYPRGDTIYVPAEYATIQTAIDASSDGGTVLVSDGTYTGAGNRDLDFGGRNITVQSVSGDPAVCVIDCENTGRGFYFHSGETNRANATGFTIRNGSITGGSWPDHTGGGIYITDASPTISNCIIAYNTAESGGGFPVSVRHQPSSQIV